jgi:hypothetical protein
VKEKKDEEFSTFDAMRIVDIKRGRLMHWMNGEFIPTGKLVPWGRGFKTAFNLFDLYSIAFFKECVDFSLSRKIAKEYMEFVDWNKIIENGYELMVVQYQKRFIKDEKGRDKFVVKKAPLFRKDREELGKLRQSQIGFFIDLKRIMDMVNTRV